MMAIKTRQISDEFMNDLLKGCLNPLLKEVQEDDTLDLELRGNAINIYYRGGSLYKIEQTKCNYKITFNTKYLKYSNVSLTESPTIQEAKDKISFYKNAMDKWFKQNGKFEREFQQVIARENNYTKSISKATDYYFADIEYAGENNKNKKEKSGYRFDMIAIKWLSKSSTRKKLSNASLSLVEVKYGDGALGGSAGIVKHLADFQLFLDNRQKVKEFSEDITKVFKQKCELGLVDGLQEHQYKCSDEKKETDYVLNCDNIEVIFILANHDPDTTGLAKQLQEINPSDYKFPIKVAMASFMGYGLYVDKLVDLAVFRKNYLGL